jgi:hypothetical protein
MNNRKIVGYKTPTDLWNGEIKKGSLYVLVKNFPTNYAFKEDKDEAYHIPKEIVETWEPVYEEEYKVGDWVITKDYSGNYDGKALKITKLFEEYDITYAYFEPNNSTSHNFVFPDNILRKATPEEIEKATTEVVRMGGENGFDLTVKNKKIYHKNEDITGYVSNVKQWWWRNCDQNFNTYSFKIKDIILSKTGCESKETRLSEWIALADKIGV